MADAAISDLRIDTVRLQRALAELGRIGAYHDERLGVDGVRRLALTDADAEARRRVRGWFEEAGLEVTVDRIGNVYGRRRGEDETLAPVLSGSHIDSVPSAGRFDGCLGVLGALEVVRTLDERGVRTRRPLVIAFFTDEEGCRFGTDMLGSAVATGRIPLEEAWAIRDAQGRSVREELERIGFLGDAPVGTLRPYAMVECHIEQGPILAAEGKDLGVVTGVQAITWHELTIEGRAAHAGTTPIEYRRDAGLAAARIAVKLREMATSSVYGAGMRATMGIARFEPGAPNVVPAVARASVDLRNPSDEAMARAEQDLVAFYEELERELGVTIAWRRTARTPAVTFDPDVQARIAAVAERLGLSHRPILSGAGHDAQEWARIAKTAMIFVPGEHHGISHNPLEYSTPEQCCNGVNVLLHVLLGLADEV